MNNKQINKELMIEINKILKNKKIKKISEKEHKQINKELMIEIKKILNNKKMKGGDDDNIKKNPYQFKKRLNNDEITDKCDNLLNNNNIFSKKFKNLKYNSNNSKWEVYKTTQEYIDDYQNTTKSNDDCLNTLNDIMKLHEGYGISSKNNFRDKYIKKIYELVDLDSKRPINSEPIKLELKKSEPEPERIDYNLFDPSTEG